MLCARPTLCRAVTCGPSADRVKVYMVPSRYATGRVPFVIYREALLSPTQSATLGNADSLRQDDVSRWEEDDDFELDLTLTDEPSAQCMDCDCDDDDGAGVAWHGACACHTYQPTECYCEGRGECWWCNIEVEETLLHDFDDEYLIDCLAPENFNDLDDAHANRWMETSYEPSTPCATPDAVDMYAQLGFDFLA
uniref:Uncharacterized protein n=1 Tax=Haptolina ericina TaxID=156174 RepID=A0A7S3F1N0_9EUKA|mmetsp:Transcript_46089/g.103852  ORF Transcript_46089/g.103852 Transcript_46089/m.103852 type:complete len:194 (+) Transcript_46089:84-665(+)